MPVQQLSIFLENKAGRLAGVLRLLAGTGVNIRALALADTTEFGVLRLIVDDLPRAQTALRAGGYTATITDVLAVEVPDRPGGLSGIMDELEMAGINVEYMYAFVEKRADQAIVIFRIENLAGVLEVFKKAGIRVLERAMLDKA